MTASNNTRNDFLQKSFSEILAQVDDDFILEMQKWLASSGALSVGTVTAACAVLIAMEIAHGEQPDSLRICALSDAYGNFIHQYSHGVANATLVSSTLESLGATKQ